MITEKLNFKDQTTKQVLLKNKGLIFYLKKGYTLKELLYKATEIKIISKIKTLVLYNFYSLGKNTDIHYTAVVDGSKYIQLGNEVWIQRGSWLAVPLVNMYKKNHTYHLSISDGCRIGANATISACNKIDIKENVLFGPNVTVLDHYHCYENIDMPVSEQGIKSNGTVTIEKNCWVGANAVIYSSKKDITIGRNCVIASNSVIRSSTDPYSIYSGNPAIKIKEYDFETKQWVKIKDYIQNQKTPQ